MVLEVQYENGHSLTGQVGSQDHDLSHRLVQRWQAASVGVSTFQGREGQRIERRVGLMVRQVGSRRRYVVAFADGTGVDERSSRLRGLATTAPPG